MILLDMFIKRYIIMNYEKAKHRSRAGQADQQGGDTAAEISIKSKGHRIHERGVWDIPAASISLCARGGRYWKGIASSRAKRSGDGQIACWVDQGHSAAEQENENKYQWDCNRSDEDLFKTEWDVRKIKDRRRLSMSSIG